MNDELEQHRAALVEVLRAERASAVEFRPSGASDVELDRLIGLLADSEWRQRTRLLTGLAMLIDWNLADPLTLAIEAFLDAERVGADETARALRMKVAMVLLLGPRPSAVGAADRQRS